MKYIKLFEQFIGEGKMPDKYIGNDNIVYLKTGEDSRGANYNLYYKGHNIDVGGRRFNSEKALKDFAANYILSNSLYNRLRFADEKPLPESFINESGNSVQDAIPFKQDQVQPTVDWIVKNIFPSIGLSGIGDDAAVIGSAGKKLPSDTSGDIDIAVSADKIAGSLGTSLQKAVFDLNDKLKSMGYDTKLAPAFNQVSFGAPIGGNRKNGVGQVDLMLTDDLNWSKFIYHSPDFRKAESKYKGAYRNLLLMSAIGQCFREIVSETDEGDIKEYEAFVIRLNQGIVKVRKSFEGKRGLLKNPKLLKEFDKLVTREPQEVVNLLFTGEQKPSDVDSYEKLKSLLESGNFRFPQKLSAIMEEFKEKLEKAKLPLPSDVQ